MLNHLPQMHLRFTEIHLRCHGFKRFKYCDADVNLIEYSNNCTKTSGSLRQYCRDEPNDNLVESELFKFNTDITGKTPAAENTKDVKIAVPI